MRIIVRRPAKSFLAVWTLLNPNLPGTKPHFSSLIQHGRLRLSKLISIGNHSHSCISSIMTWHAGSSFICFRGQRIRIHQYFKKFSIKRNQDPAQRNGFFLLPHYPILVSESNSVKNLLPVTNSILYRFYSSSASSWSKFISLAF